MVSVNHMHAWKFHIHMPNMFNTEPKPKVKLMLGKIILRRHCIHIKAYLRFCGFIVCCFERIFS